MNERKLVDECLARLRGRYYVRSAIVVGSAAHDPDNALDLDLCLVVTEEVLDRARMRICGTPVDLFVCGAERVRKELLRGLQQHLKILFAGGRHVDGDASLSSDLIKIAQHAIARAAPEPLPTAAFAFRSKPHGLLRKFYALHNDDRATAGLIVSALVQSSVEAYFALNRLWVGGVRQTVGTIKAGNPAAAAALQRVTEADLRTLCEQPEMLDDMVRLLVGNERIEEETWIIQEAPLREKSIA